MTNEEIVIERLNKNIWLGKNPIKFSDYRSFLNDYNYVNTYLEEQLDSLKRKESVKDRVHKIIEISRQFPTAHQNNKHQCRAGANRSTVDIWRIYKNYFGDVDIFTIMRALYILVAEDKVLGTYRCPNVRKRVFWIDVYHFGERNQEVRAELGVPLREWKNIGLNENEQAEV